MKDENYVAFWYAEDRQLVPAVDADNQSGGSDAEWCRLPKSER